MTFISQEPDTDLSKPLEIYDPIAFRAAIHTIMSILIYQRDAVEPVVANVPDPCLEITTITEPGL
jgi:hypothetical protein